MKNTQAMQLMSIVWLSAFMLGMTVMSCNSKKEQQLPAIGKSVALFDYFSYKGNDDFIYPILYQVRTISTILFCRDGIPILVFAQMEKVTTFS